MTLCLEDVKVLCVRVLFHYKRTISNQKMTEVHECICYIQIILNLCFRVFCFRKYFVDFNKISQLVNYFLLFKKIVIKYVSTWCTKLSTAPRDTLSLIKNIHFVLTTVFCCVPPKSRYISTRLHIVTSRKTEIFVITTNLAINAYFVPLELC